MSKSKLIINAATQGEWKWKVDKHFTASLVSESGTILEAVYSDNHEETADIGIYARSHDMDFITTFNPEHVAKTEAVVEATKRLCDHIDSQTDDEWIDDYDGWDYHKQMLEDSLYQSNCDLADYRKERGLL